MFVVLCAGITGYAVWNSFSFAEAQRQKIYVLDEGKSLMLALSQDLSQNRPVEAREHIKRFHELFFTLSPDKSAIESNINRALFLVDKSAFRYYQDMSEKVTTTALCRVISIRLFRLILWHVISMFIPIR